MQTVEPTLEQQADSALSRSPYFSSTRVRLAMHKHCAVVEGVVSSYFQKQMAQETLLRLDGIRQIDNRLQVLEYSTSP